MDGPNVNWKTIEIIKEYREHDDPDDPDLIEIGSCVLGVLHGAYGTAHKATDWNLDVVESNLRNFQGKTS